MRSREAGKESGIDCKVNGNNQGLLHMETSIGLTWITDVISAGQLPRIY